MTYQVGRLDPESRFAHNDSEVAAKVFDDEAVLIHLERGTYYSIAGAGAVVWERLGCGASLAEIVDDLTARYNVDAHHARTDVENLIAQLLAEGLVSHRTDATAAPGPGARSDQKLQYIAPVLHAYEDMADLLALDPPMPTAADPEPVED
jgi:hypothetical protein